MEIPIKINLPDQQIIDPLGQKLINVTVSEIGVRQRPGCQDYSDLGTGKPITGIFDWREQGRIIAISDSKVFSVSPDKALYSILLEDGSGSLLLEDGSGTILLESAPPLIELTGSGTVYNDRRAIFADYGDYLYIATGGKIVELHPEASVVTHGGSNYLAILNNVAIEPGVTAGWETYWATSVDAGDAWNQYVRYGSGHADELEDPDAPTQVAWIGIADKYLLALEMGTQKMWFSVVGEPWNWDSDYVSAEFMPDNASCMRVYNGDVWVGGPSTVQQFNNDGVSPWVPSGYGAVTSGVLAPYSFVSLNSGVIIYIDDQRRLVQLTNRVVKSLNSSLDTYLSDLTDLTDAIGDYITLDGVQYYILQLPTEQKTVSLNLDNGSWSEWLYNINGSTLKWNGNCITMVQPRDMVVIGDSIDGIVKELSSRFDKDNALDIVSTIRAPRAQTEGRMRSTELILGFKKVSRTASIGDSSLRIRWRDDGEDWSSYREVMADNTKTDYVSHVRRCGSYKNTRQYEFDCTNMHPYALQMVRQND